MRTLRLPAVGLALLLLAACSNSEEVLAPSALIIPEEELVPPPDEELVPPRIPNTPVFVIGDAAAHALGDNVNFWGAQWWKHNAMSGAVSSGVASFKGFATQADRLCGGTWSSRPGNSSKPPSTLPADVVIGVTSKVVKNDSAISGNIREILLVHHDGGYGPNPGHAATPSHGSLAPPHAERHLSAALLLHGKGDR